MSNNLSWINDEFYGHYCITFARGLNAQELLHRFGGDPSHAWLISFGDLSTLQEIHEIEVDEYKWLSSGEYLDKPILQVGQCGDWAFALESFWALAAGRKLTSEGMRPEILRAVSVGTVAVSVTCVAMKAFAVFSYAEDGVLIAQFDPMFNLPYGDDPSEILPAGDDPLRLLPLIRGVDIEGKNYMEAVFALAEAVGVRLDQDALAKPLLTGEITPLLSSG